MKTRWNVMVALYWMLALSAPLWAGVVTRPSKTCGTTSYTSEVAAGCTTIKSSEVDADLNAIITGGVNNIETSNINSAGLGTAAYATGSVTGAKIASQTITAGNIVNQTITSAQIAPLGVSSANLAVNASNQTGNLTQVTAPLTFSTVETTVVQLGSITTRGGLVLLLGQGVLVSNNSDSGAHTITVRVYRDASVIRTMKQTIAAGATTIPVAIPGGTFDSTIAGAHVYKVTMQSDNALVSISNAGYTTGDAGNFAALELS